MNPLELLKPIQKEMEEVEKVLYQTMDTGQPLLKEATCSLISSGGKRLRPAFVLLSGSFFTGDLGQLVPLAASVELVHMATLVHDDVIDNSFMRRGQPTVKARYGNKISVYAGNYVLARSLALVASYNREDLVRLVAEASSRICLGEIEQMQSCFNLHQGLRDYLRRIERKTALLMELSCRVGAEIAGAPADLVNVVKRYGHCIGMAFQITDDILDFTADESILGKPTGSDISQGIITLPAMYALRFSPERNKLRELLSTPEKIRQGLDQGLEIVRRSGGIEFSYDLALRYIKKAQQVLKRLPKSESRQAMINLADFVLQRNS